MSDSKRSLYIAHLDASHQSDPIVPSSSRLDSDSIWDSVECEVARADGIALECVLPC